MILFIGVPCYDGKVVYELSASLLNLMPLMDREGHRVVVDFEPGNCYVPQSRNFIAARFLDSGADMLLFIDSDMGFCSHEVPDFLAAAQEVDILCGLYPNRRDGDLIYMFKNLIPGVPPPKEPVFEIGAGPTGFMAVKREVFDQFQFTMPQLKTNRTLPSGREIWSYFDTGMLFDDGEWYGEDYAFCLRYRDIGGKVHGYSKLNLQHIGRSVRQGALYDRLQ